MIWLVLQNISSRAVAFLAQLVIAAILFPADFGLIGLAYTISNVGGALVTSGVDIVLLQRSKAIRFWIASAFWGTFGLGCLGCIIVVCIAPFVAHAYNAPRVLLLADIVGLSMPLSALGTVPNILLRARFAFRQFATINFVEVMAIQGLTIALAYGGAGALSFVIPLPLVAAAKTLFLWLLVRPDIRLRVNQIGRVRYLFGSSAAVFINGLLMMLIGQGDYVILGLLSSQAVVGVYFFAFKMGSQPLLLMASSLSGVLFPALSKLRHAQEAQAQAAFRSAKMLGLLIMPSAFLQAALIEPAIHVFFAVKWDASIPLMQILSIGLGFDAIAWVAGALQTARGGFRQQLIYTACSVPAFVTLVLAGAYFDSAIGVALSVALFYIISSPLYSYLVFRRVGMTLPKLAWIYLMPACLSAVAVLTAIGLAKLIGSLDHISRIFVVLAAFCPIYVILVRIADPLGFEDARKLIEGMVHRR